MHVFCSFTRTMSLPNIYLWSHCDRRERLHVLKCYRLSSYSYSPLIRSKSVVLFSTHCHQSDIKGTNSLFDYNIGCKCSLGKLQP